MSSKKSDPKNKFLKTMLLSVIGLVVGYYIFDEVSSWEEVPLGQVFYIVVGGVFMAASGIVIFLGIKTRYFPKKKKKRSRPVFLEDVNKKSKSN